MRVLMFGWEFPPNISGGLGAASYGLTKGMSRIPDLSIRFVIPKVFGDEDQSRFEILGANNVEVSRRLVNYEGFLREIEYLEVNSSLVPYTSPEEYEKAVKRASEEGKTYIQTQFRGKLNFTGGYGKDLFQEIANYAIVASTLGEAEDFDIIHSHDYHTGIIPVFLRNKYKVKLGKQSVATVLTIHNLAHQGITYLGLLEKFGLDPNLGNYSPLLSGMEFYGKLNCMKGAIIYSDIVSTVSKTYATEILQK
jgi:glycogen synthase